MIKKRESLADKIAGVLNAAPANFNPDEETTETSAKVVDFEEEENDDDDELLLSKFRKQNVELLEDVDTRYAGRKGSRSNLKDSDEESSDEIHSEDDKTESDQSKSEDENSEGSNDSIDDESEEDFDTSSQTESNFKHLKASTSQNQTGFSIRNQLNLWESLLEVRIQLQKCLVTSNKLPQLTSFDEMKSSSNEFANKVTETKKTVSGALDKMLELQNLCIKKYPETKSYFKKGGEAKVESDDDEEIPSDTEEESDGGDDEEIEVPKKKQKIDYENEICEIHNKYKPYRNSVIQKWNDKTRIASGKQSAGHSVLNQIEHNLSDRTRLIKRTQLKRSEYDIIGQTNMVVSEAETSRAPEEYNSEIYDDDDFYHQLLRELIEVKSADVTDPVQLGRQWIQLQNLRSKMKRKIDTKATKGRKIRYAIHTKLVNFMAPIDDNSWTDEAKTELFSSLFGKNQTVK